MNISKEIKNSNKQKCKLYYVLESDNLVSHKIDSQSYCKMFSLADFYKDFTKTFLRNYEPDSSLSLKQKFKNYIESYLKGEYVLLKTYQTINSNYMNKVCFISNFNKLFNLGNDSEYQKNTKENFLFNGNDFYQLLKLCCNDFPKETVFEAINLIIISLKINEESDVFLNQIIEGKLFLKALYIKMIYHDFLNESANILNNNNSIDNYAKSIFLIYKNFKTLDIYENFYGPPLGMIYSFLIKYYDNEEKFSEKIVFFNNSLMEFCNIKGSFNYNDLVYELMNDKNFDYYVEKELKQFNIEDNDKEINEIFDIINNDNSDSDSD